MRSAALTMAMFALLKVCGAGDEAAPVPPVGAAASGSFTVTAQHGGVMVAADDAWIELVTKQDGEVEAWVVDAQGQPLPQERATVTAVSVQGTDGRPHDVQLAWDPGQRRYAGRVEVQPAPEQQPEVQVVVRGQPRRARAPRIVIVAAGPTPPQTVVVAPPPRPTVVVQAPQPPQATVVVHAPQPPQATVVVERPRVGGTIVVGAPDPRPGVVVLGAPDPRPGVVVVAPDPRPGVVVVGGAPRAGVVVVDGDGHPGRGHGHAYGRRGREGGTVVVSPPRPGAVVVTPPSPGRVVVRGGGGGGRVEVRGGGGGGHGGGRGRGRGH